jgi:hypothetical protein
MGRKMGRSPVLQGPISSKNKNVRKGLETFPHWPSVGGAGAGPRDPIQSGGDGKAGITYLMEALDGRGKTSGPRACGTEKTDVNRGCPKTPKKGAVPTTPIRVGLLGQGGRAWDLEPELLHSVLPVPVTHGGPAHARARATAPSAEAHGRGQECWEGRRLWGLSPGR